VKYRELVKDQPLVPPPEPEEAAPAAQISEAEVAGAIIYEAAKSVYAPESVKEEPPPAPAPVASEAKSIWEVFGVPRPSETGEAAAVTPEPTLDTPVVPPPKPSVAPMPEAVPAKPETPVVAATSAAPAAPPEAITFPPASSRAGLRVAMRRRMVSLRRP
jgi:hypothetical protein